MNNMSVAITPSSFKKIRDYVYSAAGIIIGPEKSAMVINRLWKRLELIGSINFENYLDYVSSPDGVEERSVMLDLLTTNETYFFREPAHFNFLRSHILPEYCGRKIKIWCAAASSGEEPYSLGMVMQEKLGASGWQILATDISNKVLATARKGIYRMERLDAMPESYLKRFCMQGVGEYDGRMAVCEQLRANISFEQHNLLNTLTDKSLYDVIFLRNVLIYFDQVTKQKVIQNLLQNLRPGGWLIIGHCETIHGLSDAFQCLTPSIYRKVEEANHLKMSSRA